MKEPAETLIGARKSKPPGVKDLVARHEQGWKKELVGGFPS
jgi:hypothetical protein